MYRTILRDSRFFHLLFHIDQDLADQARASGCPCGGALHSARYPRKPRGGPSDLGPEYEKRFSFCCAVEGCRRRTTPPSVRYLGRRVYLGAVVVLVSALRARTGGRRVRELREFLNVDVRTVRRWCRWWREIFVRTSFWKGARGRFLPSVNPARLPASLWDRFAFPDVREQLIRVLVFLIPLSTRARCSTVSFDPHEMHLDRFFGGL
jgi:hypothetical protein